MRQKSHLSIQLRELSRFLSLKMARLFIAVFLLPSCIHFSSSSVYMIFLIVTLAPVLNVVFLPGTDKKRESDDISFQKKYHYTKIRHHSESIASLIILLFLFAWQLSIPTDTDNFLWNYYPAIAMILYILVRFLSSFLIHHRLHKKLMDLTFLEE